MLLAVLVLLLSCGHVPGDMSYFPDRWTVPAGEGEDGRLFGLFEEDVDALEKDGLVRFVLTPREGPGRLFGDRGVLGEPVRARSGERLEIRWEGFFPGYRLYYFPSPEGPGVLIGKCNFAGGCNSGFYLATDDDGDGVPDRFYIIQWTSKDYGYDEGVPGYLDRYRHIYDARSGRYYVWHDLLIYRCDPPMSLSADTCDTICKPPYETRLVNGRTYPVVFRTRLVESRTVLDEVRE